MCGNKTVEVTRKKNGSLWVSVIHPGQKPETSTEGAKEAALQIIVFQRTFLKILLSIQNKFICLVLFSPVCYWREKLWRFSIQNVNYQDVIELTFTRTIWASSSLFDFCSGSNIFVFLSTQTWKYLTFCDILTSNVNKCLRAVNPRCWLNDVFSWRQGA